MNLTIELPDDVIAALKAQAQAKGISPSHLVSRVIQDSLKPSEAKQEIPGQGFETGYGMWAKYGPAPSAEEIDENRREMFRSFAQDV